jgi:FKBP-type peptidyl-prolyl cis-trans isomerase
LGGGKAINGVDIGIGGMCEGEVRELDIPSGLGYGAIGSSTFDIPGDIRLWWRIELLQLTKRGK